MATQRLIPKNLALQRLVLLAVLKNGNALTMACATILQTIYMADIAAQTRIGIHRAAPRIFAPTA